MEHEIFVVVLVAVAGCLAVALGSVALLWRLLHGQEAAKPTAEPGASAGAGGEAQEEGLSPQEREARRLAQEAQRRYEEGFVNLMRYDGSPRRREEEGL